MTTLLHIDCSPQRRSRSISRQLTSSGAENWLRRHPDGRIVYHDLQTTALVGLGQEWLDGADLDPNGRSEEQGFALIQSEVLAEELLGASTVLIGASMHNLTLPAELRLWLEHVILPNRTLAFKKEGPVGLLLSPKVVLVVSTEGEHRSGAQAEALKLELDSLQFLFRLLGVKDLNVLRVTGADRARLGEVSLHEVIQRWRERLNLLLTDEDESEPAETIAMRRTA